jgi:hypothetical protein
VKDGVEGRGEPGVAIADEEPEPPAGIVEVHGEVAGQLGQPGAGRCAVTPRMCTRRVACSMTNRPCVIGSVWDLDGVVIEGDEVGRGGCG